jgi:hypothetical protein
MCLIELETAEVAEVGEAEEGEAVHIKSMEKIYENI